MTKRSGEDMYNTCLEHVELAMEIIIDEKETAPIINQLTEDEQLSTTCAFCKNNAIYSISE